MKILIVNNNQFGYHLDTYKYCENLSVDNNVTYICFDFGMRKIKLENVKVIYLSRSNSFFSRALLFFKSINAEIKINSYDIVFVKHFKYCFPISFMHHKVILDIRTASVDKRLYKRRLEDLILKFDSLFFKHISIISESVAKRISIKFSCILPLGADPFGKIDTICYKNGFDLIYVGTYTGRNLHEFILGMSLYIDSGGLIRSMTIIGSGCEKEYNLICEIISEKKLENIVKFTGFLTHNELYQYVKKANVGVSYVPQTPFYDKQPVTKTIEYLATGLPVIATSTEGNSIYVNSSNGILIEDNPNSVCEGLNKLHRTVFVSSTFEKKFCSWGVVSSNLYQFMESIENES
jgi:glycosyltransferase involved in cell wall biosynthesis